MKTSKLVCWTPFWGVGFVVAAWMLPSVYYARQNPQPSANSENKVLNAFASLNPIDAHAHVFKQDPNFSALLKRLHLGILNICVIDDRDPEYKGLEPQRSQVLSVAHDSSGRAVFCTTFNPYDFEKPEFSQRVIRQLNQDYSTGAVAVKIYKTIGMEIKTKAGKYLMADDPIFDPIFQDIASHNRTLVAHLAEPDSCWAPSDPASPDYSYYKEHPGEYAYVHPEWPSKADILAARDRMLARNPNLRVVGAHLGSMETDVNEIAKRFDRYSNFAVDTAARVPYFMLQPHDTVRAFLIKYQDRVLYGTDLLLLPKDNSAKALKEWEDTYKRDWNYFATNQTVQYQGHNFQGLQLPEPVLRKFFHDNAVRWFPGIANAASQSR